jgi:nitronate monooxygenase
VETFEKAVVAEDFDAAAMLVGEAIGLVRDIRPAADIVRDMARDAARILGRAPA